MTGLELRMGANGLAWIEQADGISVVVTTGDVVPGVGTVTAIDSVGRTVRTGKRLLH